MSTVGCREAEGTRVQRWSTCQRKIYVLDANGLYAIQQGDSVNKIACNFEVRSKVLKEANEIDHPRKLPLAKKSLNASKSSVSRSMSANSIQQSKCAPGSREVRDDHSASGVSHMNADSDNFLKR
jgi:hypothetical protein